MTINVGEIVKMKVARENEYGYFLTLDEEDVMLHKSDLDKEIQLEEEIEVFIFNDKSGRKAATTIIPRDMLDDHYSWATVASVNEKLGAFLNIGISKDILVSADDLPKFRSVWPAEGDKLFVTLKVDRMNRLFARLATENVILDLAYEATEEMKNKTFRARPYKVLKIGTFALTDEGYRCFIHESQQGSEPRMGQLIEGRVVGITKEGDLNGSLVPRGHERLDDDAKLLLTYIEGRGGSMPFTDKSSPEDISRQFGMSKAAFKRALGRLMKFGSVTQVDGWTKITEKPAEVVSESDEV